MLNCEQIDGKSPDVASVSGSREFWEELQSWAPRGVSRGLLSSQNSCGNQDLTTIALSGDFRRWLGHEVSNFMCEALVQEAEGVCRIF